MSSSRKLTDRIAWSDEARANELLDWETNAEDFDRLCEVITDTFAERDGMTTEQLYSLLPEEEFRRRLRKEAEEFHERTPSLILFLYFRMKGVVICARRSKE